MSTDPPASPHCDPLARTRPFTVVGLGELLWDILPAGKFLGGAPANFAYNASLLGDCGEIASRVGYDDLGRQAIAFLREKGLGTSNIQLDPAHPTGTVQVRLDARNQPRYEIPQDSAWDFLDYSPDWRALAARADAVCFGSLAQRSRRSRASIESFLNHTCRDALRVFDVNIRQPFFSASVLRQSLQHATVAKLNDDELPEALQALGLECQDIPTGARVLREEFGLLLVCITRGPNGSLLLSDAAFDEQQGVPVQAADTVGAGDAFTAGMVHALLRTRDLAAIGRVANMLGAWAIRHCGGMPPASAEVLANVQALLP